MHYAVTSLQTHLRVIASTDNTATFEARSVGDWRAVGNTMPFPVCTIVYNCLDGRKKVENRF